MGIVYKAVQLSSGREMAIKLLRNFHEVSEESVKRFRREAKAASALKHPNIVTVFDFGSMRDGQPYIVTEFLSGLTLSQFLRVHGHIDTPKARAVIKQVCEAVGEAHRHQIIHRDLKPENIVLQEKDSGGRFLKVVDFGIAKMLGETGGTSASLTMEGKVCGSPAYMSPEQCRGAETDYRCDIYSLGVLIYETLTGKRPFAADDLMGLMFMHVNEPAPKLSSGRIDATFTPELEAVVRKAMQKEPKDRQQSAEQLWEEFNAASGGRVKKTKEIGWIPFGNFDQPEYLKLPGLEETSLEPFESGNPDRETKSQRRKRLRKLSQGKFWFKAAAVVIVVGLGTVGYVQQRKQSQLNAAQSLASTGRPEDAVRILERLKESGELNDKLETLNAAYVQAGVKLGKKRQYNQAIDLLQRVPSQSKYKSEAQDLLKKFRRRT
jgi:serine/threonine protein kinase